MICNWYVVGGNSAKALAIPASRWLSVWFQLAGLNHGCTWNEIIII